jgi:hypothetical protein
MGLVGGFVFTLAWVSAARAQALPGEADAVEDEPRLERAEHWYGWQTLVIDGGATAVFVTGLAIEGEAYPTVLAIGALGFVAGGPIVHVVHERYWTSLGSLALRIVLPGFGGFIGAQFSNLKPCPDLPGTHCEPSDPTPLIAGALIGAGAASAIDAALLGFEPAPRLSNERSSGALPPLRIAPRLGLSRGALSVAFVGAF